jgi:hypothetical protein
LQLQHERNVLEKQPAGAIDSRSQAFKDLADEAGLMADNPGRSTRLTEILTGESGCDQIDLGERAQLADVRLNGHSKSLAEYFSGTAIDLANHPGTMTSLGETELDPADASE